jgi:hypothetical protein
VTHRPRVPAGLAAVLSCTVLLAGCGRPVHQVPVVHLGALVITLTGGPDGSGPTGDTLTVASASTSQEVTVRDGEPVTLSLLPGVYSIKAADGKACMTGVRVTTDATVRDTLLFPYSGCEDASGPPPMNPPGGLPTMPATPPTGTPGP